MRLWPFGSNSFLSPEAEETHYRAWQWLLRHLGGRANFLRSPTVLPTRKFFPLSDDAGHARAQYVFDCVRGLAGVSDWPCRLVEQQPKPEMKLSDFAIVNFAEHDPAGTFSLRDEEAVITYEPGIVNDPFALVATFAHEIAHHKLAKIHEPPPDGEDTLETVTDLTTIYMGFGIFGANCAFNFSRHQDVVTQGWQWSRLGYLSERDWVFGIAVFLKLRGELAADLKPFLKPHLYGDLNQALKYLNTSKSYAASFAPG